MDAAYGPTEVSKRAFNKSTPASTARLSRRQRQPGAMAKAMGVPRTRVERIASETSGITADTALRLSKALGTSAQL
jgi:plasmid maintenance system antidote protein VapI